jgi:multimeric flavodoxin WrbA
MLNELQEKACADSPWDFSGFKALFLNCTLKRTGELSHTEGLIRMSKEIMERLGVTVDVLRPVDYAIAEGVYPDMTEHGWDQDDWPEISEKVMAADILVVTSPIWLGDKSSVCTRVIERLYSSSGELNEHGQYAYYGRVGGCLITGNEDGAKHCAITSSIRCSISATSSRPRRTRPGSARRGRGRPTSTPARAGRRTTSPTATPPS